jgi:hypothetical protein
MEVVIGAALVAALVTAAALVGFSRFLLGSGQPSPRTAADVLGVSSAPQ